MVETYKHLNAHTHTDHNELHTTRKWWRSNVVSADGRRLRFFHSFSHLPPPPKRPRTDGTDTADSARLLFNAWRSFYFNTARFAVVWFVWFASHRNWSNYLAIIIYVPSLAGCCCCCYTHSFFLLWPETQQSGKLIVVNQYTSLENCLWLLLPPNGDCGSGWKWPFSSSAQEQHACKFQGCAVSLCSEFQNNQKGYSTPGTKSRSNFTQSGNQRLKT